MNTRSDIYDLHCHSTVSDGALAPSEVIRRASGLGVTALALTDHDSVAGLAEAELAADASGLRLIPGIELSASWQGQCFHIVGLNIDRNFPPLAQATERLQAIRLERAERIALKLRKQGIDGALDAVKAAAGEGMITRTHFADFLLSRHHVATPQEAFDRFLAKGKPAYVATPWAELTQAVEWIRGSGGVAVLAHPLRYDLTAAAFKRLLTAFKDTGGQGIEVVTGRYNADEIIRAADYAARFELLGSVGSDFHSPGNLYVELGRLAPLPEKVRPVWSVFG